MPRIFISLLQFLRKYWEKRLGRTWQINKIRYVCFLCVLSFKVKMKNGPQEPNSLTKIKSCSKGKTSLRGFGNQGRVCITSGWYRRMNPALLELYNSFLTLRSPSIIFSLADSIHATRDLLCLRSSCHHSCGQKNPSILLPPGTLDIILPSLLPISGLNTWNYLDRRLWSSFILYFYYIF